MLSARRSVVSLVAWLKSPVPEEDTSISSEVSLVKDVKRMSRTQFSKRTRFSKQSFLVLLFAALWFRALSWTFFSSEFTIFLESLHVRPDPLKENL